MRRLAAIIVAGLLLYLGALAATGLLARPAPADLIVVLGNAVMADGQPSPRLRARLDAALVAYKAGLAPQVLVSGGIEPGGQDEAASMAAYLAAQGMPAAAIALDARGNDTWATARATAALLGGSGRVIVATQWFHVPRTLLALRRFGLQSAGAAWPRFWEARDLASFVREAVALPWYAVRPMPGGD